MQNEQKPSAFVLWLRAAQAAKGFGLRQFAQYIHISHSHLSDVLAGKMQPGEKMIQRLAAYFRVNPNELWALVPGERYTTDAIPSSILLDEAMGILLVTVIDQEAGAGGGVDLLEYEYIHPTITSKHRNVVAVKVRGDCMTPTIGDGDVVIVDRETTWESGQVVLCRIDDRLVVHRGFREDGHLRLHRDNPSYQDILATEAEVLGRVIRVIKEV